MQQWERKEIRQCDYKNHRIFTLRCISKGLVAVSIRLTTNRKDLSAGAIKILKRAERQLLQDRVKCITNILQDNREGIASSESRLFTIVTNQTIQQQCTVFIDKVREDRFNMVRDRQVGKFLRLLKKSSSDVENNNRQQVQGNLANSNNSNNYNNVAQSSNNNNLGNNVSSRWVVNLSSTPLTQAQISLI